MGARWTANPGWRALPECPICGDPVRRATWDANGGVCTGCRDLAYIEYPADPAADPGQLDLVEWQAAVARRGAEDRARAAARDARRRERRDRGR